MPFILEAAGLDKQRWFTKMSDYSPFQTTTFAAKKFHIRSSIWQFSTLLPSAMVSLPQLTPRPKDYEILTFNVIWEGYEACKDPSFASAGACTQRTQLGF